MAGLSADASVVLRARANMECDGVASQLFELLWRKDLPKGLAVEVRIPDTVLYRSGAPAVWYFTSVEGSIKKKKKEKLNSERIFDEFTRKASPSGIIAYFVASGQEETVEDEPDTRRDSSEPASKSAIEYFDADGLHEFLFERDHERGTGILQKFIHPNGEHNTMVRALWSPNVCVLERRTNRRNVNDRRLDANDRAVTFEGADHLSDMLPVHGSSLVTSVHHVAESMVEHVAAVTGDGIVISRMALSFKTDARDRLWLLFASSVRLRENERATPTLRSDPALEAPRPCSFEGPWEVVDSRRARCQTCAAKVPAGSAFEISYRALIAHADAEAAARRSRASLAQEGEAQSAPEADEAPDGEADSEVPRVLHRLHPRLTAEEFRQHRHDAVLLHRTARVCEDCFLRFSAPVAMPLRPARRPEAAPAAARAPRAETAPEPQKPRKPREVRTEVRAELRAELRAEVRAEMRAEVRTETLPVRPLPRCASLPALRSLRGAPRSPRPEPPPEPARPTGAPYLRELQGFVAQCGARAGEVLGPRAAERVRARRRPRAQAPEVLKPRSAPRTPATRTPSDADVGISQWTSSANTQQPASRASATPASSRRGSPSTRPMMSQMASTLRDRLSAITGDGPDGSCFPCEPVG